MLNRLLVRHAHWTFECRSTPKKQQRGHFVNAHYDDSLLPTAHYQPAIGYREISWAA
jgi:hypothetical protein